MGPLGRDPCLRQRSVQSSKDTQVPMRNPEVLVEFECLPDLAQCLVSLAHRVETARELAATQDVHRILVKHALHLIDGPGQLSLPVVAAGVFSFPSTAVEVCRVDAVWHGEPVRVLVHALPAAGTHPHPDTEEQP